MRTERWSVETDTEHPEGLPDLVVKDGEIFVASIHATGIEDEEQRNACLIAAAPTMRRLLQQIYDDLTGTGNGEAVVIVDMDTIDLMEKTLDYTAPDASATSQTADEKGVQE